MIPCILHPCLFLPPLRGRGGRGCTIGMAQCRAILFHLFYFHFLQYIFVNSSRNRFIDRDSNLYTYKIRGYIRGFYEAESSSPVQACARARAHERAAEKSQKILSDFAANSAKYGEEFFAGGLWIFRSCYWHTPRWNLFTTSLMATLSYLSQLCGIIPAKYTCT